MMATRAPVFPAGLSPPRTVTLPLLPLLLASALVLRWPQLGDATYALDEQFYLLVGDRLLHGALPYVDIWDRKPIGLFLVYAGIRLLGGEGVLQYQLVATLFAGATAWVIARIALRAAGAPGGFAAGLLYLFWIETMEGGGGQSPVFYNLFIAGAAACVLRAGRACDSRRSGRMSFAAMALAGLAIQIKYTAAVEGCFLGLVLAWWTWRRADDVPSALTRIAALVAVALAPTLLAGAAYVALGEGSAFWFANFVSIFRRGPTDAVALHYRATQTALHLLPLAVCAVAGFWHMSGSPDPAIRQWRRVMIGWLLAALAGCASIGVLLVHYTLPVFVPLAIAAVPIVRRGAVGWAMVAVAAWLPLSHLDYPDRATPAFHRRELATLAALIPSDVRTGCMQMLAGPPILYHRTGACFVTRYVFPNHLIAPMETPALGTDAAAELDRVIARRPRALVTGATLPDGTLRTIRDGGYRAAGQATLDNERLTVWLTEPRR